MANRLDPGKSTEEVQGASAGKAEAPAVKAGGGKVWVPVIANIVLMPAVAYALTTFVLIPKIQGGKGESTEAHAEGGDSHGAHGGGSGGGASKGKFTAALSNKILVNVAGTAGTRYLVANMTLVGKTASFKSNVDLNDPQLRDTASTILGGKTISDLEKPGMRNVIRAELISAFNDILGKESVLDIYLTEFAIQ